MLHLNDYLHHYRQREKKTINTENALLYNVFSTCTFIKSFGKYLHNLFILPCNSQKSLGNNIGLCNIL